VASESIFREKWQKQMEWIRRSGSKTLGLSVTWRIHRKSKEELLPAGATKQF
jgi:hypothetical protein